MKEPNRVRKNPIQYNIQLDEEQKAGKAIILQYPITLITGQAGCLGLDTEVLMYNGTFKKVQDIVVGDQLMGPDSKPRNVLSLCRGIDQMYWIRQNRGIDYRVNSNHILSLIRVQTAKYPRIAVDGVRKQDFSRPPIHPKKETVTNIEVNRYFDLGSKKQYMGYISNCLFFEEKNLSIDPYYLGLWLGDGSKNCIREITAADSEIINYLIDKGARAKLNSKYAWLLPINLETVESFKDLFSITNSSKLPEKFIPNDYLFNSKENRLKLLAGLLDSDGHYIKDGKYYEIIVKNKRLADNITFLCRSLGYKTNQRDKKASMKRDDGTIYKCIVQRISIMTEDIIPVIIDRKKNEIGSDFKNRKYTGFKIEKDIIDNYYGFTLDEDNLFLLKDLTVTHNSGKSLVALQTGLDFVNSKMGKMVLTRSLVEVGDESMGYLPGDAKEKLSPYLEAAMENLEKCMSRQEILKLVNDNRIVAGPVNFMRGKTVEDVLIVEEGQNLTIGQMLAVLTRTGKEGKIIITGDLAQKDRRKERSYGALDLAIDLAKDLPEYIGWVKLNGQHRHDVVSKINDLIYSDKYKNRVFPEN
jgi:hypothetical protein